MSMTLEQLAKLAATVKINEQTLKNFKAINARSDAQNAKYQQMIAKWKLDRRLS